MTETNLVALRRVIYLTIQSSLDFEECAHKMLKINLKPGQEVGYKKTFSRFLIFKFDCTGIVFICSVFVLGGIVQYDYGLLCPTENL